MTGRPTALPGEMESDDQHPQAGSRPLGIRRSSPRRFQAHLKSILQARPGTDFSALRVQPLQEGGGGDPEKPSFARRKSHARGGQRLRGEERAVPAEGGAVRSSGQSARRHRVRRADRHRRPPDQKPRRGGEQRHAADRGPERTAHRRPPPRPTPTSPTAFWPSCCASSTTIRSTPWAAT